jgi:hypothetical protein
MYTTYIYVHNSACRLFIGLICSQNKQQQDCKGVIRAGINTVSAWVLYKFCILKKYPELPQPGLTSSYQTLPSLIYPAFRNLP